MIPNQNDAEFVQNLNNSFKKERGFQIKLNPQSDANRNLSFSKLSAQMSARGKVMFIFIIRVSFQYAKSSKIT